MENKEIIELIVPESALDEYVAQINISEGYFSRVFKSDNTRDYSDISAIVIEGIAYEKILTFIESFPASVEVVVIENTSEQYLYTAQLMRHGVHFTTRLKFLDRFISNSEATENEERIETTKETQKTEKKFNILSKFSREKPSDEKSKRKISDLLNTAKTTVQKVELRTTEKEKLIPVIKIQEKEVKNVVKGTYILYGSAFTSFFLAEYFSNKVPIALVDLTGELNYFYGSNDNNKISDFLSNKDDPLIVHGNIIYYSDSNVNLTLEELLKVKELLLQETMLVIFYLPASEIETVLPVGDKILYCLDESEIIKGKTDDLRLLNSNKIKMVVSERVSVLTRNAIREKVELDDSIEIMEIDFIEVADKKSIYKSILKKECVSKSIIEKYFKKISEQL